MFDSPALHGSFAGVYCVLEYNSPRCEVPVRRQEEQEKQEVCLVFDLVIEG